MNESVKELQTAVVILSRLTVSGDAVDMIAAVKHKIRNVIAELEKQEKGQVPDMKNGA